MPTYYGADNSNDTLSGGTFGSSPANDWLYGRSGNDTYTFTEYSGDDVVEDSAGTDRILFDSTVLASRIRLDRSAYDYDDLVISIVDANENVLSWITINEHFNGYAVESMQFSDGSTISLIGGLTIQGTVGNTSLRGTANNDTIVTSHRDETLYGGAGNDTYLFTAGHGYKLIEDEQGTDEIRLGGVAASAVRINVSSSDYDDLLIRIVDSNENTIDMIEINEHFNGYAIERLVYGDGSGISLTGGLTIRGAVGNTTLRGTAFNDTLEMSSRNETLYGGGGNDTYVYSPGDTHNYIHDSQGNDQIRIVNIAADRVRLNGSYYSDDLIIRIIDKNENIVGSMTINDHFDGAAIETMLLAGKTIDLRAGLTIQGAVGNTTLYGTAQNDRLIMSARDETLYGGVGNDTYVLGKGDARNVINDSQGKDTILVEKAIKPANIRLNGTSSWYDDLKILVVDRNGAVISSIVVDGHFGGREVETLRFQGGGSIDLRGGLVIQGAVGETQLYGTAHNDTLVGSDRNETFHGGNGSDTYRFGKGFGKDVLYDAGGTDTLDLTGNDAHRVSVGRLSDWGNTLYVQVKNKAGVVTDEIQLADYFAGASNQVEKLVIGNESWSISNLLAGPRTSNRADKVGSFLGDTLIEGKGGNDRITDLYGNNIINGGAGKDQITTGIGNDVLTGGAGNDTLSGGGGNDRLRGDAGADVLTGGAGRDVFVFAKGMGTDRVTDFSKTQDKLELNANLWAGKLNVKKVIARFATDTGDDIVLDFGANGKIVLEDVASIAGLAGAIEII